MSQVSASFERIAQSYHEAASNDLRFLSELAIATRFLRWYKDSGDRIRNMGMDEAKLQQRSAILNVAYQVLENELEHTLDHLKKCINLEDFYKAKAYETSG